MSSQIRVHGGPACRPDNLATGSASAAYSVLVPKDPKNTEGGQPLAQGESEARPFGSGQNNAGCLSQHHQRSSQGPSNQPEVGVKETKTQSTYIPTDTI